jgi:hypothetical protein
MNDGHTSNPGGDLFEKEKDRRMEFNLNDFQEFFFLNKGVLKLQELKQDDLFKKFKDDFENNLSDDGKTYLTQILSDEQLNQFILVCVQNILNDYHLKHKELSLDCFLKFTFFLGASVIEKYLSYLDELCDKEKNEIIFEKVIKDKHMGKVGDFFATFSDIQMSHIVKSLSVLIIVGALLGIENISLNRQFFKRVIGSAFAMTIPMIPFLYASWKKSHLIKKERENVGEGFFSQYFLKNNERKMI